MSSSPTPFARCTLVPRNFTIAAAHRYRVRRIKDQPELILRLSAVAKYTAVGGEKRIITAIDNGARLPAKFTQVSRDEISRSMQVLAWLLFFSPLLLHSLTLSHSLSLLHVCCDRVDNSHYNEDD